MIRLHSFLLTAALLVGCTADPPDGVVVESEAGMPWQNPDTVSVTVTGEKMGGSIAWDDPDPEQLDWLEGRGYKKDTTLYSERATNLLQDRSEGIGAMEDMVMGRVYYVQMD